VLLNITYPVNEIYAIVQTPTHNRLPKNAKDHKNSITLQELPQATQIEPTGCSLPTPAQRH